jgi:cell division protein FtsB
MKELQRKQVLKRVIYSIPSIIILALVTVMLIKGAVGIVLKERESARLVKDLEVRAELLENREMELKNDINRLQTEEGIIEEIKGKFRVSEEGEYVAIIVEDRARVAVAEEEESLPWYKRFWNAIIGK